MLFQVLLKMLVVCQSFEMKLSSIFNHIEIVKDWNQKWVGIGVLYI
jgi:hypothetical protein